MTLRHRFYRKAVALYVKDGQDSGKASVEKVLFILVESGLVVLTSLVIITIFNVTRPSSSFTHITAEGGTQLSTVPFLSTILLSIATRSQSGLKTIHQSHIQSATRSANFSRNVELGSRDIDAVARGESTISLEA
ncbi:hypothetical protein K435DRAFT_858292 [Dendrothele bispora CBS 962.96]|uniref:Uncharacterized protein n=1 Tax=Dendrothele bispora (strain CBS 962.96) TaxID=1314807 RepID=A0A4S8M3Z9_DENBC|nr:hypothetical protein K435DRAFT_858292 [Dendrothele bispora CBS 962.96]